jgi:hypothetical protein
MVDRTDSSHSICLAKGQHEFPHLEQAYSDGGKTSEMYWIAEQTKVKP